MTIESIQTQANEYCEALAPVIEKLGVQVITIDHAAIKCADSNDYEETVETLKQLTSKMQYIEMNNRRIATATLTDPIHFGQWGSTSQIEIMEPRPEKVGQDKVGFEHIEIISTDLTQTEAMLTNQGIPFSKADNGFHQALEIKLADGQEVKFTNKSIFDILGEEEKIGRLIKIK